MCIHVGVELQYMLKELHRINEYVVLFYLNRLCIQTLFVAEKHCFDAITSSVLFLDVCVCVCHGLLACAEDSELRKVTHDMTLCHCMTLTKHLW